MITYTDNQRLQPREYLEFLTRTDLGQQYPQEDFIERITTLVQRTSITITARDEVGLLVGVAMGVTDFAYYLLVTDLGVDREYTGQGIGRELLERIHTAAGGKQRICVFLDTYTPAQGFYRKCGFEMADSVMYSLDESAWTFFDLTPEKLEELTQTRPLLASPSSPSKGRGRGGVEGRANTLPEVRQHARTLRKALTPAESKLWAYLRKRQAGGVKFRRQHPIGPYITDFCSLSHRLVIEVDGSGHLNWTEYDARRTAYLEQRGYRVIRFWNHQVLNDIEEVMREIELHLLPHP